MLSLSIGYLRVLSQVSAATGTVYGSMPLSFRMPENLSARLINELRLILKLVLKMPDSEFEAITLGYFSIDAFLQALQLLDSLLLVALRLLQLSCHLSDLPLEIVLCEEESLLVLQELTDLLLSRDFVALELGYLRQVLIEELDCIDEELVTSLQLREVAQDVLADFHSDTSR